MTRLSDIIAPSFASVHADIKRGGHTHYWLPGGRGSCKSSFASIEIPLCMMRDAAAGRMTHAIVLRRYSNTLRESVVEQIRWALDRLGAAHLWQVGVNPMRMTYLPTGQTILFRGVDDASKLKSIKVGTGYIR